MVAAIITQDFQLDVDCDSERTDYRLLNFEESRVGFIGQIQWSHIWQDVAYTKGAESFWEANGFSAIHRTTHLNPLTPNDPYNGRTAPLTSKRCILYIYSTNIGTEYFKHGIYSPFLSLQNAGCFIILTYLGPVLFTFYIQAVLKFKKIIPAPKG